MLGDIKSAVDRIENFPRDAEKPVVTIPSEVEKAMSGIVYGDQPLSWLRKTAESLRDDLITKVGLAKEQLAFPRAREGTDCPQVCQSLNDRAVRRFAWR